MSLLGESVASTNPLEETGSFQRTEVPWNLLKGSVVSTSPLKETVLGLLEEIGLSQETEALLMFRN